MISGLQEITFNGHDLQEFGCVITEPPVRPFPKRRYEKQSVYGRSGDLVMDGEAYDNIQIVYKAASIPGLYGRRYIDEILSELKAWLCSSVEYRKLYDTQLRDGFFYAFCSDISDAVCTFDDMYEFSITFDCKPFFYFDIGQKSITAGNSVTLFNPGNQPSKPVIQISGSGTIGYSINGSATTILNVTADVYIDSERQLIYSAGVDKSDDFFGNYPIFVPGNNTISFTGSVFTSAEIIPRWCRL
jgi:phage-related protein